MLPEDGKSAENGKREREKKNYLCIWHVLIIIVIIIFLNNGMGSRIIIGLPGVRLMT